MLLDALLTIYLLGMGLFAHDLLTVQEVDENERPVH